MDQEDSRELTGRERLYFAGCLALLAVAMVAGTCVGCNMPMTTRTTLIAPQPLQPPATVRLYTDKGRFECTAWKVGENRLATAGHCCEDELLRVGSSTGPEVAILWDDDTHDICVLDGHIEGDVVPLASEDPAIGDVVWTAGYPRGTYLISTGYWSGRENDDDTDTDRGICSTVVGGGASGSPILNARGEAVGVLVAGYHSMDSLTFVATIEWLRVAVLMAG